MHNTDQHRQIPICEIFRAAIFSIAFAVPLSAQVAAVPKPVQLAQAKKVFISNANDSNAADSETSYAQLYTAIQGLNRFALVLAPADADLILEFSGVDGKYPKPDGTSPYEIRESLKIYDPKTHVLLWSMTESATGRLVERGTNVKHAIDRLAADLQRITTPTAK